MPGTGGAAPVGTVTFLFTDLEGSTRLWEQHPEAMKTALARHDEILRTALDARGGFVVKTTGDGLHAAFPTANDAVLTAIDAQRALDAQEWALPEPLRVRMGVHTGEAEIRDGDYYGGAVNRAARLADVAHGGQVVVSHATAEVAGGVLGTDTELVDLGEHRLRDLARAERVFQVRAAGLVSEFPPLRSVDAYPGNLPRQLVSFVGREREVGAAASALRDAPLVMLTGVGGVGKTRLAIQVAADVLPAYPDGAWLCELASADGPEALIQLVAATLGVIQRPDLTLEASIIEFLRPRTALLVLDNCEHLLDAAGTLAERVLQSCPDVRILATSREGLAVEGERVLPLRSLALPSGDDLAELSTSDAAQLFVDRAASARPGFAVDASNGPAVGEICRRLDGIPLAIELAAARVVAMSPGEIASHLDERFRLLTGGRRTAVERHQTLRATVDWSYGQLAPKERAVFDRLGCFVGGFDAAAAAEVAASGDVEAWDVIDALGDLVAKSMLVADEDADGATRYQLLETLRHYARERMDEGGDPDAVRRRHAMHYTSVAETIAPAIFGPDEGETRRRLYLDLDNLRAAVTWALDRGGDDADLGLRILAALADEAVVLRASGIGTWAEAAIDDAERAAPAARAAVLAAAAWNVIWRGDYERGRTLAEGALRDGPPLDCPATGSAFTALSIVEQMAGEFDRALDVLQRCVVYLEKVDPDDAMNAFVTGAISMVEAQAGRSEQARAHAAEAVALARSSGSSTAMAQCLFGFGWAWATEDPATALAALDESIELSEQGGGGDATLDSARGWAALLRARDGERRRPLEDLRAAVVHGRDVNGLMGLINTFDLSARTLIELDELVLAAVLSGAVAEAQDVNFEVPEGPERTERDAEHARMRGELGTEGFERAAARGAAMSGDEIIHFTLDELDRLLAKSDDDA